MIPLPNESATKTKNKSNQIKINLYNKDQSVDDKVLLKVSRGLSEYIDAGGLISKSRTDELVTTMQRSILILKRRLQKRYK